LVTHADAVLLAVDAGLQFLFATYDTKTCTPQIG
jgi:hypothetical protein